MSESESLPLHTKPTAAHIAEYAAVRGTVGALRSLGWRTASSLGARLGALGYAPFGIRREVVERQVAAAFPELPPSEVLRIARASYESLGRTFIETSLLPGYTRQQVIDLFDSPVGWDALEDALSHGRGALIVTGHLGNWELGGSYVSARGIPLDVVTRRMANPLFDRYLRTTRGSIGMHVVHDADAVRRTPRALKENRAVALLTDQDTVGLASTFVPFFGRRAKTPRGPAVFALRLKTPVLFGAAIRQPDNRFRMIFERIYTPESGDRESDIDAIVANYTAVLEKYVRQYPEQYFWHHRRWKRSPDGEA
jgi:KDO2-lipid IV(A) lauroyltransferase